VGWVVGEQVRVVSQLGANRSELGPDLVQVGRDQGAGVRVDGQPAVLVGLGVLADALTAADHIVESNVHQAAVQIDVADLQAAQLATAHAGDHHQPQVQTQGGAPSPGLGDHLGDVIRRGGRNGPAECGWGLG